MQLAGWQGEPMVMERHYVDVLRFDDYLLANYQGPGGPINVYAAYYRSQEKGRATHSPKTCIPGGGWEITSLDEVVVPGDVPTGSGFRANRVMIQKGERNKWCSWFKQRHRVVTSEYLVRVLPVPGCAYDETDGRSLIGWWLRCSPANRRAADHRVMQMAAAVQPLLPSVPD
jgi:EpsI family protein